MATPTLRLLAAALLLTSLAACGGSDSPDPEPSASADEPAYSLDATFTDTGEEPSPLRTSEIIAALASRDTGTIAACPLGDDSTFLRGVALQVQDPAPLSSSLSTAGELGDVQTVTCTATWMIARVAAAGPDLTVEEAVAALDERSPGLEFAEPQPFLGGKAFAYCFPNESTDKNAFCGAAWLGDGIFVMAQPVLSGTTEQELADYLSETLPLWIG